MNKLLLVLALVMVISIGFFISKPKIIQARLYYVEAGQWDKECWMRALKKLDKLCKDTSIRSAALLYGQRNGEGHAWIGYVKDGIEYIYDPSYEVNHGIVLSKKFDGEVTPYPYGFDWSWKPYVAPAE